MQHGKRPREDQPPQPPETRCRYLKFSNLPHGCTSSELKALLEPLGKVEELRVARASGGGMLALVEMSCTREATSAKRRLSELPLRGSALTISFDVARSEQQGSGSGAGAIGSAPGGAPAAGGAAGGDKASIEPPSVQYQGSSSKLPPFYLPKHMERDVATHQVVKMRSVLWTAREDDIRQFFRGITLDRDSIEMGRDFAGRFSGMVYVRLRSAADCNAAMRRANDYLCGRSVILSRIDVNTPGIFRPADERAPAVPPPPRDVVVVRPVVEPRPWPTAASAPKQPAPGWVGVQLTVGSAGEGQAPSLSNALANAPLKDSLQAVREFLTRDPRLPATTRNAAAFLDQLRTKLLAEDATASGGEGSPSPPVSKHLFRSPFEAAGVLGYSMPEVEHVFGTRSSDSVFWPMFATFNTLLPHEVDEETAEDESVEAFVAG
jgi:RNA recognition motif-containing protein